MLHGIDISNHQGDNGIVIDDVLPYYDFCICKATGGNFFVDAYCDGFIQKCIKADKLWGFYHFANDGVYSDAETEADFFYDNCRNYFGHGIPILDWEVDAVSVDWVNRFVNRIHDKTGVWCWIYGNPWRFSSGNVDHDCGRWIAAYPAWITNPQPGFDPGDCPDCDGLVAAWQYASDGKCPEYWGNLDVNVFYGDEKAWKAYALGDNKEEEPNKPDTPSDEKYTWHFETEHFIIDITEK